LTDKAAFETLIAQLETWQRGQKLLMVVIDTLAMSMIGADENSARDMGMALSAIRQLIETLKCAVLLVHHSAKHSASERGSSALRGNADSMIKVAAYDDLISVECAKAKDFDPFEQHYYRLHALNGSVVVVPCDKSEGDKRTMTQLQQHVLEALQLETCIDGVTLRDLGDIVGAPISSLHRAVSRLIKHEYVTRGKRGYVLTAKAKSLVDPARSMPDPRPQVAFSPS
jgi:DNA-binding MarR family transcriptional regulator